MDLHWNPTYIMLGGEKPGLLGRTFQICFPTMSQFHLEKQNAWTFYIWMVELWRSFLAHNLNSILTYNLEPHTMYLLKQEMFLDRFCAVDLWFFVQVSESKLNDRVEHSD